MLASGWNGDALNGLARRLPKHYIPFARPTKTVAPLGVRMAKTAYLIRHGQSTFNALFDLTPVDPLHFDARLSPKGIRQVEAARQTLSSLHVDLIAVSPLTRAIETAVGIFSSVATSMIVTDLLRERLGNSCDVGRPPAELAAEFPMLSFDHLDDPWWHIGEQDQRGVPIEPDEHFNRHVSKVLQMGFRTS